ncbi:helix-turn-helix transcriptional regulator [Grimontia sp. SpTr1]|uniref:helix-turn-helix domain-containing protein n=1 Tax=Grimontia sp. SpTr1 TaxID=2995319 RepID=UPI00248C2593|nr:helix-turn-helix transcriptional regulator [Grimontia sp. SpTr1]
MKNEILKELMKSKGFDIMRLAIAAGLGESTIKRARRGNNISAESISAIASVLGVTVAELSNGIMTETQSVRVREIKAQYGLFLSEFRHLFNVYVSSTESEVTAKMWLGELATEKAIVAIRAAHISQADSYRKVREQDALLRALVLPDELENYSNLFDRFMTNMNMRRGLSHSRSRAEYLRSKDIVTTEYRESISALQDYLQQ